MGLPKVSVIWLNYNSMKIFNVVSKSLLSLKNLDYPNLEVILVDNGSTDGSFEAVKNIVDKWSEPRVKIVRLARNLGFTGGNNAGFRARDKESRYVLLLNNDIIVYSNSLKELVEYVERDFAKVGAAQPIIYGIDGKIESIGLLVDELLNSHPLFRGFRNGFLEKPLTVTYTSGAYSLYRVKAVLEAWNGVEKLFYEWGFGYFDDNILGLQLWSKGWMSKAYPVKGGLHMHSKTFGEASPLRVYLSIRNQIILGGFLTLRYKPLLYFPVIRDFIPRLLQGLKSRKASELVKVAVIGIKDARKTLSVLKNIDAELNNIETSKIPLARISLLDVFYSLFLHRRMLTRKISKTYLKIL